MSEFELPNISDALDRIDQVVLQASVPELEQDWVAVKFELKQLRSQLAEAQRKLDTLCNIIIDAKTTDCGDVVWVDLESWENLTDKACDRFNEIHQDWVKRNTRPATGEEG